MSAAEDVVDAVKDAGEVALPVIMSLEEVGDFLKSHGSLIRDIMDAFEGGATAEQVRAGIRSSMVIASDAAMTAELGPRP